MTFPAQPVATPCAPNHPGLRHRPRLLAGFALGMAVGVAATAWPVVGAAAGPDWAAPAQPVRISYTVVAGDTLDRVIKKQMADSPLKPEVLRQAFVALNPQAFEGGNVNRLRAGAVLQVPDAAHLLRSTMLPLLEGTEAASLRDPRQGYGSDERKRWVRFP